MILLHDIFRVDVSYVEVQESQMRTIVKNVQCKRRTEMDVQKL